MTRLLAAFLALLLLCSCGSITFSGAESLLVAPKLNKRQEGLSRALEDALSQRGIVYKSPQSGDYRSAFIFFDLDGDLIDEAIVFYAFQSDEDGATRTMILTQSAPQNGGAGWTPVADLPSRSREVDFVRFEHMLDLNSHCMLIGWQGAGGEHSTLQIASLRDGRLNAEEYIGPYLHCAVENTVPNSLAVVTLLSRSGGGGFYASLVRSVSGYIEAASTLELTDEAEEILNVTGPIDGKIYIDEQLTGGRQYIGTEIIGLTGRRSLTLLCGGDGGAADDYTPLARENFEQTVREEAYFSADYDGDGSAEVPFPTPLPSNMESSLQPPSLVRFMRLVGLGFEMRGAAVINAEAGYLLNFPERWVDTVTVEQLGEAGEWRFMKWNTDLQEPSEELLRVRVSSSQDYLDTYEADYTVELAARAALTYSAYVPQIPGEPLAVTGAELRQMFRLLPG